MTIKDFHKAIRGSENSALFKALRRLNATSNLAEHVAKSEALNWEPWPEVEAQPVSQY